MTHHLRESKQNGIQLGRFNFVLRLEQNTNLNWYSGSMLRGVFGQALRQVCCMTKAKTCDGCMLLQSCPFPQIFQTPAPPHHSLHQCQTIPNPYIIEAPNPGFRSIVAGEEFSFSMVLIGSAIQQLSLIIFAWQRAIQRGITKDRVAGELVRVEYITPSDTSVTLYEPGTSRQQTITPFQIVSPMALPIVDYCQLQLTTPLRMKEWGKIVSYDLSARVILQGLLRRYQLLCEFHGLGKPDTESPISLEQVDSIRCTSTLQRFDWHRYSSRQQQEMNLGGVMGTIELEGDLEPFAELLTLGQWFHLGGKATFGLGRYVVTRLSKEISAHSDVTMSSPLMENMV